MKKGDTLVTVKHSQDDYNVKINDNVIEALNEIQETENHLLVKTSVELFLFLGEKADLIDESIHGNIFTLASRLVQANKYYVTKLKGKEDGEL